MAEGVFDFFTWVEFRHLFRAVAFWIDDPSTWRSFALTCRYFSELAHEFAPMKKKEFSISLADWAKRYNVTSIDQLHMSLLPNGSRHGVEIYASEHAYSCEVWQDGKRKFAQQDSGNIVLTDYTSFLRCFVVRKLKFSCYRWGNNLNDIITIQTIGNSQCFMQGYMCPLCKVFHDFIIPGNSILYRSCLGTEFHWEGYSYELSLKRQRRVRRVRVARQVIDFMLQQK